MVVWNDLEADEKVKVYDKGVQITNREGVYDLLVSYRSGDMWAPRVEQTEALKAECSYFIDCIKNSTTPFNDGTAGTEGGENAGGCEPIDKGKGEDCPHMSEFLMHRPRCQAGKRR